MRSRLICCFSCSGKTHFVLNNWRKINCIDHDFYDWRYRGNLGDNWMTEYICRIDYLQRKFDFVFVNAIPEVIEKLREDRGDVIVYPYYTLKEEWYTRAINRDKGRTDGFAAVLNEKWDEWINACKSYKGQTYLLNKGEYVSVLFDSFNSWKMNF